MSRQSIWQENNIPYHENDCNEAAKKANCALPGNGVDVGYEVCLGISTERVLVRTNTRKQEHIQYSYEMCLSTGQLTLSRNVSLESR